MPDIFDEIDIFDTLDGRDNPYSRLFAGGAGVAMIGSPDDYALIPMGAVYNDPNLGIKRKTAGNVQADAMATEQDVGYVRAENPIADLQAIDMQAAMARERQVADLRGLNAARRVGGFNAGVAGDYGQLPFDVSGPPAPGESIHSIYDYRDYDRAGPNPVPPSPGLRYGELGPEVPDPSWGQLSAWANKHFNDYRQRLTELEQQEPSTARVLAMTQETLQRQGMLPNGVNVADLLGVGQQSPASVSRQMAQDQGFLDNYGAAGASNLVGMAAGLRGLVDPAGANEWREGAQLAYDYDPHSVGGVVGELAGEGVKLGLTAVAPAVGLSAMGGASAGNFRNDVALAREHGASIDAGQEWGGAILFGGIEVAAEKIGLDAAVRGARRLGGLAFQSAAAEGVAGVAKAILVNAGEEAFTEAGQNVVAREVYDPGRSIMEGVPRAAAMGGLVGAGGAAIGGGIQYAANRMQPPAAPSVDSDVERASAEAENARRYSQPPMPGMAQVQQGETPRQQHERMTPEQRQEADTLFGPEWQKQSSPDEIAGAQPATEAAGAFDAVQSSMVSPPVQDEGGFNSPSLPQNSSEVQNNQEPGQAPPPIQVRSDTTQEIADAQIPEEEGRAPQGVLNPDAAVLDQAKADAVEVAPEAGPAAGLAEPQTTAGTDATVYTAKARDALDVFSETVPQEATAVQAGPAKALPAARLRQRGFVDPTLPAKAAGAVANAPGKIEDAANAAATQGAKWLVDKFTAPARQAITEATAALARVPGAETVQALGHVVKQQVVPQAYVPAEAAALIREAKMRDRYNTKAAQDAARVLTKGGTAKHLGLHVPRQYSAPLWRNRIYKALTGEQKIEDLPADLQPSVRHVRAIIDELGQRAVSAGLLSKETYEQHKGAYLPRFYRKWELDRQGGRGIISRFKQSLERFKPRLSDAFAIVDDKGNVVSREDGGFRFDSASGRDAYFDQMIASETAKSVNALGGGKILPADTSGARLLSKSKEMQGIIRKTRERVAGKYRKVDPLDAQALEQMGIIDEPGYPVAKAILQLGHDVNMANLFNSIAGKAEWVADQESAGFRQMPSDRRYGALAGRWVQEDIAREMVDLAGAPHWAWQAYDSLFSLWKMNKTVFNPGTQGRNILGNIVFADFAGVNPLNPANWPYFLKAIRTMQGKEGRDALRDLYREGVLGSDFASNELKDALRLFRVGDISKPGTTTPAHWLVQQVVALPSRAASAGRSVASGAKWLYSATDNLFKVAAYVKHRESGASAKEAGEHVRKWFPHYDNLPTSTTMKAVRRYAPFFAFQYESVRIGANAVREKPVTFAKWLAIPSLVTQLSFLALGIDDDDEKETAIRNMRGKMGGWPVFSMLLPFRDEDGRLQQWDLTNVISYADILGERIDLGDNEDPWWQQIAKSVFLRNPAINTGVALATNRDTMTGHRIAQTGMSGTEETGRAASYVGSQALPPLTPFVGTGWKALEQADEVSRSALSRRNKEQIYLRTLAGVDLRYAGPQIYQLVDDYRKDAGLSLLPDYDDTNREGRLRTELYQATLNEDQERFGKAIEQMRESGMPLITVKRIREMISDRHPLRRLPKVHHGRFMDQLNSLEREAVEKTLDEYRKVEPRAVEMLGRYYTAKSGG